MPAGERASRDRGGQPRGVDGLAVDEAGLRTYGDVASGAPHLITAKTHSPGLGAPVVSDEAVRALWLSEGPASPMLLIEASLWLLADWDGMGTARASALAEYAADPVVKGLAHLLAGRVGRARDSLWSEPALAALAGGRPGS